LSNARFAEDDPPAATNYVRFALDHIRQHRRFHVAKRLFTVLLEDLRDRLFRPGDDFHVRIDKIAPQPVRQLDADRRFSTAAITE
jgi:hypothetical protein